MSGYLLPGPAAQHLASSAQLVVGRPVLLDDAIAGRICLAPLVPVPNLVPVLVLESPPVAGHQTPPRYATTGLISATKLSGNKRRSGRPAKKKARPCVQGGLSRRLGTSAPHQLAGICFVPMAIGGIPEKKRGRPPAAMETGPCQRAAAGWGGVGRVSLAAASPAYACPTSSFASIRIARARLSKLGDVACTSAWISANCSGVPSPAIRTTYSIPG